MTTAVSRFSALRRPVVLGVKLSVSVGLLSLLFSRIDVGRLWAIARHASIPWLMAALVAYSVTVLACVWRWHRLLEVQKVHVPRRTVLGSFLVSLFFNNFLPTNIGGDVIRIRDTARPAESHTLAAAIVLADRVIGLIGLALFGSLAAAMGSDGLSPISPWWIWAGFVAGAAGSVLVLLAPAWINRVLQTLTFLNSAKVGGLIETVAQSLSRFRARPWDLSACLGVAVCVQAANVVFYVTVAHALRVNVAAWDLALIVPLSSLVQIVPVSINGFGVREATFSVFFTRIGLPIESAVLVSLVATGLIMIYSLIGAAVYVGRQQRPTTEPELQTHLGAAV